MLISNVTEKPNTCQPNDEKSYTKQYQKHTPSGLCHYIKWFNDEVYFKILVKYTKQSEDEDVARTFLKKLE